VVVDDGSTDGTYELARAFINTNSNFKLVKLSRNFGKENALYAGIKYANGDAVLTIDSDGQHPMELIQKFYDLYKDGAQVVVGVRDTNKTGLFKNSFRKLFWGMFNGFSEQKINPDGTDFRLINSQVKEEFLKLHETDRISRGLIDWLGFRREIVYFTPRPRLSGEPKYSFTKVSKLATNSLVSMSPVPLYMIGVLGLVITSFALILGLAVFIEQLLLNDPYGWNFTGTAMLGILILFLVGLVLMSQGILSLYISHIHSQTKQRPLYIVDEQNSIGI
jgi:dolichol-phosphate mannosyltransferase